MLAKKSTVFKILSVCTFLCAPALADDVSIGLFDDLKFRHVGPGGNRTIAAAGIPGDPRTYYIGAASGGLWKTEDSGLTWKPVFDDQDVSSVGAVTVSRSDSVRRDVEKFDPCLVEGQLLRICPGSGSLFEDWRPPDIRHDAAARVGQFLSIGRQTHVSEIHARG